MTPYNNQPMNWTALGSAILQNNQGGQSFGQTLGNAFGDYQALMQKQKEMEWLSQFKQIQMQQAQNQMAAQEREQEERDELAEYYAAQYPDVPVEVAKQKVAQMNAMELAQAKRAAKMDDARSLAQYQASLDAANNMAKAQYEHGLEYGQPAAPVPTAPQLPQAGGMPTVNNSLPVSPTQGLPIKGQPLGPGVSMKDRSKYMTDTALARDAEKRDIRKTKETEAIKGDQKRMDELRSSRNSRVSNINKAITFLEKFESGKADSGLGRQLLNATVPFTNTPILPTFSDQGRFDEELNAFAETAARQQLKASGEIRPTDADVQGMKRAMFGIGRDEEVNINLLRAFIEDQLKDEAEYQAMTGGQPPKPLPPRATGGGKVKIISQEPVR